MAIESSAMSGPPPGASEQRPSAAPSAERQLQVHPDDADFMMALSAVADGVPARQGRGRRFLNAATGWLPWPGRRQDRPGTDPGAAERQAEREGLRSRISKWAAEEQARREGGVVAPGGNGNQPPDRPPAPPAGEPPEDQPSRAAGNTGDESMQGAERTRQVLLGGDESILTTVIPSNVPRYAAQVEAANGLIERLRAENASPEVAGLIAADLAPLVRDRVTAAFPPANPASATPPSPSATDRTVDEVVAGAPAAVTADALAATAQARTAEPEPADPAQEEARAVVDRILSGQLLPEERILRDRISPIDRPRIRQQQQALTTLIDQLRDSGVGHDVIEQVAARLGGVSSAIRSAFPEEPATTTTSSSTPQAERTLSTSGSGAQAQPTGERVGSTAPGATEIDSEAVDRATRGMLQIITGGTLRQVPFEEVRDRLRRDENDHRYDTPEDCARRLVNAIQRGQIGGTHLGELLIAFGPEVRRALVTQITDPARLAEIQRVLGAQLEAIQAQPGQFPGINPDELLAQLGQLAVTSWEERPAFQPDRAAATEAAQPQRRVEEVRLSEMDAQGRAEFAESLCGLIRARGGETVITIPDATPAERFQFASQFARLLGEENVQYQYNAENNLVTLSLRADPFLTEAMLRNREAFENWLEGAVRIPEMTAENSYLDRDQRNKELIEGLRNLDYMPGFDESVPRLIASNIVTLRYGPDRTREIVNRLRLTPEQFHEVRDLVNGVWMNNLTIDINRVPDAWRNDQRFQDAVLRRLEDQGPLWIEDNNRAAFDAWIAQIRAQRQPTAQDQAWGAAMFENRPLVGRPLPLRTEMNRRRSLQPDPEERELQDRRRGMRRALGLIRRHKDFLADFPDPYQRQERRNQIARTLVEANTDPTRLDRILEGIEDVAERARVSEAVYEEVWNAPYMGLKVVWENNNPGYAKYAANRGDGPAALPRSGGDLNRDALSPRQYPDSQADYRIRETRLEGRPLQSDLEAVAQLGPEESRRVETTVDAWGRPRELTDQEREYGNIMQGYTTVIDTRDHFLKRNNLDRIVRVINRGNGDTGMSEAVVPILSQWLTPREVCNVVDTLVSRGLRPELGEVIIGRVFGAIEGNFRDPGRSVSESVRPLLRIQREIYQADPVYQAFLTQPGTRLRPAAPDSGSRVVAGDALRTDEDTAFTTVLPSTYTPPSSPSASPAPSATDRTVDEVVAGAPAAVTADALNATVNTPEPSPSPAAPDVSPEQAEAERLQQELRLALRQAQLARFDTAPDQMPNIANNLIDRARRVVDAGLADAEIQDQAIRAIHDEPEMAIQVAAALGPQIQAAYEQGEEADSLGESLVRTGILLGMQNEPGFSDWFRNAAQLYNIDIPNQGGIN